MATIAEQFRSAIQAGDTAGADVILAGAPEADRTGLQAIRTEESFKTGGRARFAAAQARQTPTVEPAPITSTTVEPGVTTTPTVEPGAPTATSEATDGQLAFEKAQAGIEAAGLEKSKLVDSVLDAIRNQPSQKTAFDRLFGKGSRVSDFFQPALIKVEEQILDVEGLLESLRSDISERTRDVGIEESARRRLEAVEREPLTTQISQLTRAQTRLKAGLDVAIRLSDKEFEALQADAQKEVDAAVFELEQKDVSRDMIALVKANLQADLDRATEARREERAIAAEQRDEEAAIAKETRQETQARKDAVSDALANAMETAVAAGVIPGEQFQKVIDDANRMLEAGKSISEIQLGILRAIGENPRVRDIINAQFARAKSRLAPTRAAAGDFGLTSQQKLLLDRYTVDGQLDETSLGFQGLSSKNKAALLAADSQRQLDAAEVLTSTEIITANTFVESIPTAANVQELDALLPIIESSILSGELSAEEGGAALADINRKRAELEAAMKSQTATLEGARTQAEKIIAEEATPIPPLPGILPAPETVRETVSI